MTSDGPSRRGQDLVDLLTARRRETESRYRQALERQTSGDAAGDNEGVHGWKASREGGADLALLQSFDQTLRQIDMALSRARAGQYGRCAACGGEIPLARLRAVPFATLCVPCQSKSESGAGPR